MANNKNPTGLSQTLTLLAALIFASAGASAYTTVEADDSTGADPQITWDTLPVDADVGTSNQAGASAGTASCDLLATQCAAAIAATKNMEVKASGTIQVLGEGEIELSAGFGFATAAMATRVVLSAERIGDVTVVSHFEEDRVIPGDDCKWYNPFDWFSECEPDELVTEQFEKTNKRTCTDTDDIILDPGSAGAWKFESCGASAFDDALCFEAEAKATANSNYPGSQQAGATASNCDANAAMAMATEAVAHYAALIGADHQSSSGEASNVTIIELTELPVNFQILLKQEAQSYIESLINETMAKYTGPQESRPILFEALNASKEKTLDSLSGFVVARLIGPTDGPESNEPEDNNQEV
jgi:hypothetical protein